MSDRAIVNNLYRSGGIDANANANVRQMQLQLAKRSRNGNKFWNCGGMGTKNDALSICEGEPLFFVKRPKGIDSTSHLTSSRNPIMLLSSLNGFAPENHSEFRAQIKECIESRGKDVKDQIKAYDKLRDVFFCNLTPNGCSVTKYIFDKIGHQADHFVVTLGGTNTVYVDDNVEAGDILFADIPYIEAEETDNNPLMFASKSEAGAQPWGLVRYQTKRGCPTCKRTLVIRAIPSMPSNLPEDAKVAFRRYVEGIRRRGQVYATCIKGAKKGERCDVVLGANAIGLSSCNHIHSAN